MGRGIRVSSRAVIVYGNRILLNEFGGGRYYNFPGGGIEEGETAKQAVVREVLEESGLAVDVGDLVFSLEYEPRSCKYMYGEVHHVSFFFRCFARSGCEAKEPAHPDVNPDDPSIKSKAVWVPIDRLSGINLVPQIHKQLAGYLETGVFEPSFWAECEYI